MPYFNSADEVYEYIGGLFEAILADEGMAARYKQSGLTVQHRFENPQSQITVRMNRDARIDYGETEMTPDVAMEMEADLAHRFWLGKVSPTTALAKRQLRVDGPMTKMLKMMPLAKLAFPRYRELVESKGRQELLQV